MNSIHPTETVCHWVSEGYREASAEGFPSKPEPLLVKASEAARLLGIGTRKLWTMTNTGEIPCVRFGTAVRYSLATLRAVIARKEKGRR